MFIIMGVNNKEKLVNEYTLVCPSCGSYGKFALIVSYSCFSVFFLPLFKWGYQYRVINNCCNSTYQLNGEALLRLKNERDFCLMDSDLIIKKKGNTLRCPSCFHTLLPNTNYCPNCGIKCQ